MSTMPNPNDPTAIKDLATQFAEQLEQMKALVQMSGAASFGQIGGVQLPQQRQVEPSLLAQYATGASGQTVPAMQPQRVLFGGGSPFPVDHGPARLQNSLVAIQDLIRAASQFRGSPLGKKVFGG